MGSYLDECQRNKYDAQSKTDASHCCVGQMPGGRPRHLAFGCKLFIVAFWVCCCTFSCVVWHFSSALTV